MRKLFVFVLFALSVCLTAQEDSTQRIVSFPLADVNQQPTYTLVVKNQKHDPYIIYIGGRRIGEVPEHGEEQFKLSTDVYGRSEAKQVRGFRFRPNIIEFEVPEQENGDELTMILE